MLLVCDNVGMLIYFDWRNHFFCISYTIRHIQKTFRCLKLFCLMLQMPATVLRKKHSLKGKNSTMALMKRYKNFKLPSPIGDFRYACLAANKFVCLFVCV